MAEYREQHGKRARKKRNDTESCESCGAAAKSDANAQSAEGKAHPQRAKIPANKLQLSRRINSHCAQATQLLCHLALNVPKMSHARASRLRVCTALRRLGLGRGGRRHLRIRIGALCGGGAAVVTIAARIRLSMAALLALEALARVGGSAATEGHDGGRELPPMRLALAGRARA